MDKPYLHEISKPDLENPVFVQGLPGFGNVGRIAAHLLIKFYDAKPFAELYSPYFPDYVSISSNGQNTSAKKKKGKPRSAIKTYHKSIPHVFLVLSIPNAECDSLSCYSDFFAFSDIDYFVSQLVF